MRSSPGRSVHRLFRASVVQDRFLRGPSEKAGTAPAEMPAADRRKWRSCKGEAAGRQDSNRKRSRRRFPARRDRAVAFSKMSCLFLLHFRKSTSANATPNPQQSTAAKCRGENNPKPIPAGRSWISFQK